jgi:hypothetical protein
MKGVNVCRMERRIAFDGNLYLARGCRQGNGNRPAREQEGEKKKREGEEDHKATADKRKEPSSPVTCKQAGGNVEAQAHR